jgi:multiple sugar transport system substrate-binding protein
MTGTGHGASRLSTYDDPAVVAAIPMAAVAKAAVQSGRTVPVTPYWQLVVAAIDDTWLPIESVSRSTTPGESQSAVRAAIAGKLS